MKKIAIVIVLIILAGVGAYFLWGRGAGAPVTVENQTSTTTSNLPSGAAPADVSAIEQYQYTETFTHPTDKFSFKYPKDFTVSTIPGDGNESILIQNAKTKIGVQILITPFSGDDIDITPDIIKTDVPDLKIDNPQELLIGPNRKGLAFESDNDSFGGHSREVWFVFRGNLYQISTYAEFDPFLKGLFSTWKFL
jgi:hypothetical protein